MSSSSQEIAAAPSPKVVEAMIQAVISSSSQGIAAAPSPKVVEAMFQAVMSSSSQGIAAAPSPKVVKAMSGAPTINADEKALDAKEERVGRNSTNLTAGIIIADVVGAGILGMPVAVAQFGWLLGLALLMVMLAANVHISILMWRVQIHCPDVHTYKDLTDAAFARAPSWQRRAAVFVSVLSQRSFLFCTLALYLMSAGKGLGMTLNWSHICLPEWTLVACLIILPFACSARQMGAYQSLVWLNIFTLMGTVLIPLGYMLYVGAAEIRPEGSEPHAVAELTAPRILNGLSTFTFAMTSQFVLPEIIAEMEDRTQFPKAYGLKSAPFQLVAFLVAGIGGYCLIGDKVSGTINENIPFGVCFDIAAGCLVVHMSVSYLIKGVVFCGAVQKDVDRKYADATDTSLRSKVSWAIIAAVSLGSAWLVANLVPFFGDAVDLLGASFTPLSCWVIPIGMFLRYYRDSGEEMPRVSMLEWLLLAAELILATILMVWGTIYAIQNIQEHWHTYGGPFQCHCEGLWQTCECSGTHIGMEQCDVLAGR